MLRLRRPSFNLAACAQAVRAVLADPDKRRLTDPLWQSTEVVRSLPSRLVRIEGWRTLEFGIVTERFKAPAVVVSPRDSLVVRVRLKSVDGTRVRLVPAACWGGEGPPCPWLVLRSRALHCEQVQRSVDAPALAVPRGYVRLRLACGGYQIRAVAPDRCTTVYVNALDPNGYVPKPVVRTTMPDRAMTVAKAAQAAERHRKTGKWR
uniref:START domain-containing protein n=1 Tax=Emiliania huxleyi TaxID=2903 RepID=A0A7S3S9S8_EMIHU